MSSLNLKGIYKRYPSGVTAVRDFNLDIEDKEFIVFVGPSGCGKSTTLRMIAGLEEISEGELYIDGRLVNDVPPKDRDIAMVFQSYALYPHMTVFDNMAFALKLRKTPKAVIKQKVQEAARILGIEEYLQRKPKALSGGQKQRVALGRAIVRNPKVFLLDEPLSNLDAKLRSQMRTEITKLHNRLGTTFIYVTHDQIEAMTMGTRIVVMKDGIVQQVDTPTNLYDFPYNQFVAGFIGTPQMNFLVATLFEENGEFGIAFGSNKVIMPKSTAAKIQNLKEYVESGKPIVLGIRPEDVHDEERFIATSPKSVVSAKVEVLERLGAETLLYCNLDFNRADDATENINAGTTVIARVDSRTTTQKDSIIDVAFDMKHIHLFDKETTITILSSAALPENEELCGVIEEEAPVVAAEIDDVDALLDQVEEKIVKKRTARKTAKK